MSNFIRQKLFESGSDNKQSGFTLIEMMVVLAIIAILALMAFPSNQGKANKVRVKETLKLVENYKEQVASYYLLHGEMPATNSDAGLPEASQIMGNYLQELHLIDGALHVRLGKKINPNLKGGVISLRPVFVPDTPNVPISWICGYDKLPEGMLAAGENKTNVDRKDLPLDCH